MSISGLLDWGYLSKIWYECVFGLKKNELRVACFIRSRLLCYIVINSLRSAMLNKLDGLSNQHRHRLLCIIEAWFCWSNNWPVLSASTVQSTANQLRFHIELAQLGLSVLGGPFITSNRNRIHFKCPRSLMVPPHRVVEFEMRNIKSYFHLI